MPPRLGTEPSTISLQEPALHSSILWDHWVQRTWHPSHHRCWAGGADMVSGPRVRELAAVSEQRGWTQTASPSPDQRWLSAESHS